MGAFGEAYLSFMDFSILALLPKVATQTKQAPSRPSAAKSAMANHRLTVGLGHACSTWSNNLELEPVRVFKEHGVVVRSASVRVPVFIKKRVPVRLDPACDIVHLRA